MIARRTVRARRIATQLAAYEQRRVLERQLAAQLGAALSDPVASIRNLSRVGVAFKWRQRWALRILYGRLWQKWTLRWAQRYILHLLIKEPH